MTDSEQRNNEAFGATASILRPKIKDQSKLDDLQTRLQEVATRYRAMIATVPSDLPGAPFPEMTLTKRHEWVDANILNPVRRLRDAISGENRPLLSTWPEFIDLPPDVDFIALDAELRIPIEAGHGFRREGGHRTGLKPATVPT